MTYSQFCEAVTSAYGELSVVCGEKNVADDVSESLQNYLEDHYMEQITLYDVADYLHMNYSYLSAYISNRTGKHFSEHLNDTRIRHSKKCLLIQRSVSATLVNALAMPIRVILGECLKNRSE